MLRIDEQEQNPVPQVSTDPVVLESEQITCEGGPCDGQQMRCPDGYILIITSAVDGLRATALPRTANNGTDMIGLARAVGGYSGHYERGDVGILNWFKP